MLSKRALESSVIVDDTQVAVLGGLIQDTFTDGSDRVPVLGDLPFIGALFRYDARKRQKVNLLIFLKPTVVRTDAQGSAHHVRALRLHHGRAAEEPPRVRASSGRPDRAALPPPGTMPGTPAGEIPSTRVRSPARRCPMPMRRWPLRAADRHRRPARRRPIRRRTRPPR